jgi:hypothetical protein
MPRDATLPAASLLLVLAIAACTAPPVRLGPDADPRAARRLLEEVAATGPVRLEVNRPPRTADGTLTVPEIAEQAARGVKGLDARFAEPPDAAGSARLLLLFDPPPGGLQPQAACGADALPPPAQEGPFRLLAVFCEGGAAIADATPPRPRAGPGPTPSASSGARWAACSPTTTPRPTASTCSVTASGSAWAARSGTKG